MKAALTSGESHPAPEMRMFWILLLKVPLLSSVNRYNFKLYTPLSNY
jgi:hypothetical protein